MLGVMHSKVLLITNLRATSLLWNAFASKGYPEESRIPCYHLHDFGFCFRSLHFLKWLLEDLIYYLQSNSVRVSCNCIMKRLVLDFTVHQFRAEKHIGLSL
ncbi:hypothetical protein Y1Q_0011301 [Alligator mississippiensis]|uniref:Uncharacterized protein n=1 Tax=Alligator mississippiensis TaxID=8496 RepID=A0A151N899_ALLMI|nr:hypothetical protein Y1Q_0011301 [Alligator mississippiensis]